MSDNMIVVSGITKYFYPQFSLSNFLRHGLEGQKPVVALDSVSFSLEKGRVLGILGPNGSGKTTLLKIISTLILPDKGKALVKNYDVEKNELEIKSIIGLVSAEERSFYWRLTGRQNLECFACLYGLNKRQASSRLDYLFKLFKVDYENRRFDSYSAGMKRKFALMRALLHDPEILLLDEPTKSLDYNSSHELRSFVKELVRSGKTVILATHDLEEARNMCDAFLILYKGKAHECGALDAGAYLKLTQNDA